MSEYLYIPTEEKDWYHLPERFTWQELYDYCDDNDINLDKILEFAVDDRRDDDELARDMTRPIKDRLRVIHYMFVSAKRWNREVTHEAVKAELGITKKTTIDELYNIIDMAQLLNEHWKGTPNYKDEWLLFVEDIIYELIEAELPYIINKARGY